jgi:hypothetical protein
MILLPYFVDYTSEKRTLGFFLSEGGNDVWRVDETESIESVKTLLEENGLPVQWIQQRNDVVHAEIDHRLLKLGDFYLSTDPHVEEKDVWHLFEIPTEMWLEPNFHKVLDVLTGYLSKHDLEIID